MLRTTLTAFVALTLISSTAQASPYASSVKIAAAPGYAAPGEPAPAPAPAAGTPAPAPYAQPAPAPYGQPAPAPYGQDPYAQPGPQPAPAPYQPPPPPQRRRGKGMMIAGWSVFGASYLSTVLIGAALYDSRGVCDDIVGETGCNNHPNAGLLFIPIFGPLIGINEIGGGTATGTLAGVFLFLAQAAGFSLGVAGTTLFVRDGKRNRAAQQQQTGLHIGRGVHLSAAPRLGGGNFNLSYNF
jgi:hypothetical protein